MFVIKQTVLIFSNILAIIRERLIVDLRIFQHAFATGSQVPAQTNLNKRFYLASNTAIYNDV